MWISFSVSFLSTKHNNVLSCFQQIFKKLYRDRMNEVQIYNVVEKSKLVDWMSAFVRDVEQVKILHHWIQHEKNVLRSVVLIAKSLWIRTNL